MKIKRSTIDQIDNYVKEGTPPGGFVRAVLENNLMEAFHRGDKENSEALIDICMYVYNEVPASCHGSPANVSAWLDRFRDNHEKVFDSMLGKIVGGE